jgi:integrase
MKRRIRCRHARRRSSSLTLPELEHSNTAVLNSLTSLQSRKSYGHAMKEFITWYCSESRLALNRIIVLLYRQHLEAVPLAPATINVRPAAVRRLAYEATDNGFLSPDLVAGIRRVKGIKRLGVRVGNWLTVQEGQRLLQAIPRDTLRGKRDAAIMGLLLGCGLRRSGVVALNLAHIQRREDHWVIVDLVGKAGHIRSVPVPAGVKVGIDGWTAAAGITSGRLFRCVRKGGHVWGSGLSQNVIWYVVRESARRIGVFKLAPHDLRRSCARFCHAAGGELEQIQFLLGHASA